ncbi:MAG: T9SS type A sorting domain-containing protein [Chitinophagales bacterium]|nr:T9SS type A sorting domain-containing protein [Chitinophagaceae bacterium]MCB9065516.1 T9SS type A sorting domain-containing protein [Chitinophagales bacterium]
MKKIGLIVRVIAFGILALITTTTDASAKWTAKADVSTFYKGRWGAQVFSVGGKIYVSGGYADNDINMNDIVSYDPATDIWGYHNPLPGTVTNRTGGVAFTIDGKAYLGLGVENFNNFTSPWTFPTDLWQYNDANDTWTKKADFPGTGVGFAACFVVNNKAYVIGGQAGKFSSDGTNKVYEYDPATDKWTEKTTFPRAIVISPFAFTLNGKGYIVGGADGSGNTKKTYEYDPTANTWTEKKAFPEAETNGGVAFVANGKAYCGLGRVGTNKYLQYFWAYNPTTDSWSYADGFEFSADSRMYGVAATLDGKAYIGAGWQYDGSAQHYYRDWYQVDPSVATSVNNIESNTGIIIYPNPASSTIHVSAADEYNNYSISNITGQVELQGTLTNDKSINVSSLAAGQYIISLTSEDREKHTMITVR